MAFSWWKRDQSKVQPPPKLDPLVPATLRAEQTNPHLNRPVVFDPALKQHPKALRAGEPSFESEAEAATWHDARVSVLHFILTAINGSTWQPNLILRGSALMGTWFGDRARRPGDLDWVVTPHHWHPQEKPSQQLIKGVLGMLDGATTADGITIQADAGNSEDIWLYERAPGIRVVLTWRHPDARRSGTVQMDFVFRETMPSPPQTTALRIGGLPAITMQTASPEQSLAWKLMWLTTDMYAAGKDLYDAVLLAEAFPVSAHLVYLTFATLPAPDRQVFTTMNAESVKQGEVEWDEFIQEYPFVSGSTEEWQERLATALGPMFAGLDQYR